MDDASMRGDCARCIGLCCVALAFDRGPMFAFGKQGGEACRHLTQLGRCGIHHRLERAGMSGCAAYDCLGAGQLATAMFAGQSWRDTPAVARALFDAFGRLREFQALRGVLARSGREIAAPGSYAELLLVDLQVLREEARKARV